MAADENGEAAERPIEEIRVGDRVYSTDPSTGESGFKEVVRLYVKETDILIHIDVGGEEITTTPDHPFRVGSIWISAKDLREGDLLTLADGSKAAIEKIQTETLAETFTVYNFEVADFHTYYVGNAQVLVHNDCSAGGVKPDIGSGGNQSIVAGEIGGLSSKVDLHRPYIRKNVRAQVEANALRTPDGHFVDPNTLEVIEGKYDLGHKSGKEFWREKAKAQSEGLTQNNLTIE